MSVEGLLTLSIGSAAIVAAKTSNDEKNKRYRDLFLPRRLEDRKQHVGIESNSESVESNSYLRLPLTNSESGGAGTEDRSLADSRRQGETVLSPFDPSEELGILSTGMESSAGEIKVADELGILGAGDARQLQGDCGCGGNYDVISPGIDFQSLVFNCLTSDCNFNGKNYNPDLNCWNTSAVTDMSFTFAISGVNFNSRIDCWDVGQVTDMNFMFSGATYFNQPLNSWDVSKVTIMSLMFSLARDFNQPLDSWDVSQVITMRNMFSLTRDFDQPLDSWDSVSKFRCFVFVVITC